MAVKSPVGACIFILYFLLPWTPCPALPLHCPALALALPCFEFTFCCQGQEEEVTEGTSSVFFLFAARDRRRNLHRELFFLLLPGTGGGSYTRNSSSSSPVGGSAPLDSVTVGGGIRFDGSLVAGMDETSIRLDG